MQHILACKVRACTESKIGFKSQWHSSLDFYFSLSLLPSFFTHFFSFAGHLVGFILVGKVFRKAFWILELDERKSRWVVGQAFHGVCQVNVTWFFAFFSHVLHWIVFILIWFERSLQSAQVSRQSCPWPLKLMMPQGEEGLWIRPSGYGWLRGEWVKQLQKW